MNSTTAGSNEPADKQIMEVDNGTGDTGQGQDQGSSEGNISKQSNEDNVHQQRGEIDFNNRYNYTDKGPYYVFVEHKDRSMGRLFPIRVGYYLRLSNEYKKSILDIKIVGRNRVKVILDDRRAANSMINNELLTKNNLIAYVPKFFTQKRGVVRMVDTFFTDEYLLNNIESERKVVEVKRVEKKFMENGVEKIVKRQVLIVSFMGNALPSCIRINGVNFPVEPYIQPVIQCRKCFRYGHVTKLCKNNEYNCKKCAMIHEQGECDDQTRCIYCKTADHTSISKLCPVYQKQKRIKERMAKQNLSFKEAETIENNPSYSKVVTNNRFQVLDTLENFPPLVTPSTSNPVPITKPRNSHYPKSNLKSGQERNFSKKRKAAGPPTPASPISSPPSPLAIPNPYAKEFREYKEKLVERLLPFFSNLISRIQGDDNLFTFDIKDSLNALLTDVDHSSRESGGSGDELSEY